jgi:hypothetical protein
VRRWTGLIWLSEATIGALLRDFGLMSLRFELRRLLTLDEELLAPVQ